MYQGSSTALFLSLVLPLQVGVEDLLVQRYLLVAPGGAVQTLVVLRRLNNNRESLYVVIHEIEIWPIYRNAEKYVGLVV